MYADNLGYCQRRSKIRVHFFILGFLLSTLIRRVQLWL